MICKLAEQPILLAPAAINSWAKAKLRMPPDAFI